MGFATAIIGLVGALVGIALSNGLAVLLDWRRKEQRRLDLVCALHAEIMAGARAGAEQLTPAERHYATSNDTPFATPDETDFVFEAVKADLSLLPLPVIHPVVLYYRRALQSNLMTRDLREPQFDKQSQEEKAKFIQALLGVVQLQGEAAEIALRALETYASLHGLDLTSERRIGSAITRSA